MVKKQFINPISNDKVELDECKLPKSLNDYEGRVERIPIYDKNYVDLGIQYRLAKLIKAKNESFKNEIPIHVALKGHMGTGKDHDIEQFAAKLKYPYYRIPLSGEVRDVTLLGSVQLYGDGKGGTESKWQDGELTRALRGPSIVNLSELNAAGPEVLFALHSLQKIVKKLEVPKKFNKGKEEYIFKGKLYSADKIITLSDSIAISNYLNNADGKTKRKLIKYYYDEAKKLINAQLIAKMNDAVKWSDYEKFSHDEVLVHNFKIKGSKLIRSSDPDKAEKMWSKAEKSGMTKFNVIDQADVEKL